MVLQTHKDAYRERLSYQGRVRIFVYNDKSIFCRIKFILSFRLLWNSFCSLLFMVV